MSLEPLFPLYIPSKSRATLPYTAKALTRMGIDYRIVVEEFQYKDYAATLPEKHIVILDPEYQRQYDTLDNLGDSKSKGPGAARNFIWDHSIARGYDWQWVMDDNIRGFQRLNKNVKHRVESSVFWRIMEDFCLRYTNIAMAGPQYDYFTPRKTKLNPLAFNTRIYSCNLIRNDVPFRWRGRYNEDTILSLDMLKAGWCTVQFNALLQRKIPTQIVRGGCNDDFYSVEGTLPKSQMQVKAHPDVSRVVFKYGRWHHYVDYLPFKKNKLLLKADYQPSGDINEYGLELRKV